MPDGTARQFTFDMEPKSLITKPSGGDALAGAGLYEVTGIAWTGRGTITSVEITIDGGATWDAARLETPVLPRAHTRFNYSWKWDGKDALVASRCTDDTGYTQPPLGDLIGGPRHELAVPQQRILLEGQCRTERSPMATAHKRFAIAVSSFVAGR